MKIIRGNTLQDNSLLSVKTSSSCNAEYRETKRIEKHILNTVILQSAFVRLGNSKLVHSKYNITQSFDDGYTVLINTLSESVLLFNKEEMGNFLNVKEKNIYSDFEIQLFLLGVLVRSDEREYFQTELTKNRSAFSSDKPISVTILPTQDCNARCEYCFAKDNKPITMKSETAKSIVDFIQKNVIDDELTFRWFGGEPLLAEDIMDEIVDGVVARFDGKLKYSSIIFTNAFALTERTIIKVKEKWKVNEFHVTIDADEALLDVY